jgi:hypothetical protein
VSLREGVAKTPRAILWGGLVAGALDITAACVQGGLRGVSPVRILQSVASGLLGAGSFQGGPATAALGLVLHFVIAFGAATVYVLSSRKLRVLAERPFLCGPLYGVAVYLFMTYVVVPLSAAPFKLGQTLSAVAIGLTIHIVCIGLPIALALRRAETRA